MKAYTLLCTLIVFSGLGLAVAQRSEPQSTEWKVVERGGHHAVHEREVTVELGHGVVEKVPTRYIELATGMHYFDDGRWKEARAEFQVLPDGYAVAAEGQHKVIISPLLTDAQGAVDMETPDGKRMRSTLRGLSLFNRKTGQSMVIAEVNSNAVGQVVGGNRVLFTNAFEGFGAHVRYLYDRGSFHQDIILAERISLRDLEAAGFPAEYSSIEIWTEFLEAPQPGVTTRTVRSETDPRVRALLAEPDITDDQLDFGAMKMPTGRAYLFTSDPGGSQTEEVRVSKWWTEVEGRRFLIESIPLDEASTLLAQLPEGNSIEELIKDKPLYAGRRAPPSRQGAKSDQSILTANLDLKQSLAETPQLVMDYETINGSLSNYTFKADTTYYVSGNTYVYGSNNVVEGNAVVKYNNSGNPSLIFCGPVEFQTDFYRPAVFTAKDDQSVGVWSGLGSGYPSGYYAGNALEFNYDGGTRLEHVRISYAQTAVHCQGASGPVTDTMRHIQIKNCGTAFNLQAADYKRSLDLENALITGVTTAFYGNIWGGAARQLTVNDCGTLIYDDEDAGYTASFTNCVFANVTNLVGYGMSIAGSHNAFYNTPSFGSNTNSLSQSPFQTVFQGRCYLETGSALRDIGTTNISAELLADLGNMTTYPPIAYTNTTFSSDQTFSPQAQRDTSDPDLGYHYPPLDYLFGGCHAYANLTFNAGTAVGWFRTTVGWYHAGHGIHAGDNQVIAFQGTVSQPTYWVRCPVVQEGVDGLYGLYGPGGISGWASALTNAPTISARHLVCSTLDALPYNNHFRDDYGYLIIHAQDSEFHSGALGGYVAQHHYTNCLFNRVYTGVWQGGSDTNANRIYRNCTMNGGVLRSMRNSTGLVLMSLRDCAFDDTYFLDSGDVLVSNTNYNDYDYNAYLSTNYYTNHIGSNDVYVSAFGWQEGTLGDFYQPDDSPLINRGSVTADLAGLFHHTTQTNEVKEGATQVDIGYHYVATACNPLDEVWVEDALPAGSTPHQWVESWTWISTNPTPFSAASNHQSAIYDYTHQHYFTGASDTMSVNTNDALFAYVYLDSANVPSEVMLQWNNGSWEHRAYWGANSINWGTDGTDSLRYMGALPATGQWVRLEVPASDVGLEGATVSGMAFTLYGGRASWDYAGKSGGSYCYDTDGDGLADYLEDANGNGTFESGDLANWLLIDTDGDGLADGLEHALGTGLTKTNMVEGTGGALGLQIFTPMH